MNHMNSQYLSIDENDVLINAYNGISEYNYYNESGPGFYKFKINASNIDGTNFYTIISPLLFIIIGSGSAYLFEALYYLFFIKTEIR